MQPPGSDPRHFARAVTELGERRPVVARTAIYNSRGLKIIDKGVAINAALYERLTQHEVEQPLDECLQSEAAVTGVLLRDEARALCAQDRFCAAMVADLRDAEAMFGELALVPLPPAVAFQLSVLREMRPELWQHSLRSAVCAAWLAERSGGTRYDQRLLAAGGLLHDLGMLHLDPALQQPGHEFGREQGRQLYTHPLLAAMLLERHHAYPKELRQAVLEHHEALDGSGYPRHLRGAEQHPWGRVLALTEVVTGISAGSGEAPALRLAFALRMNAARFDPDLLREVQRWLEPLREPMPPCEPAAAASAVQLLRDIEGVLASWPQALAATAGLGEAQQAAAQRVTELCDAERRTLADSGAATAQLAMLGEELGAEGLAGELALLAREAAWLLRTISRQARRRWSLAPGEAYPPAVQGWLDMADRLCARQPGG